MITYEIKINGVCVKRVDARRIRALNEAMEEKGYEYEVNVWDYQYERFDKFKVIHKRKNHAGKLLNIILDELN